MKEHESEGLLGKLLTGIGWNGAGHIVRLIVGLATIAVIARFLSPAEMGLFNLVWIVLGLASGFAATGSTLALVQRKSITSVDIQATFQLSLLIGAFGLLVTWLIADPLGSFFGEDKLPPVLKLSAIGIIFLVLPSTQFSLLQREMNFRVYSGVQVFAVVLSSIFAIYLAIEGFGVWAMLAYHVVPGILSFVALCFLVKHKLLSRPRWTELRSLFTFGSHLSFGVVTGSLAQNLPNILIARLLDTNALGLYSMALRICDMSYRQIARMVSPVLLPAFSSMQDNHSRLSSAYIKATKSILVLTFPAVILLLGPTEYLVTLLLGDQWSEIVPLVRLLAIAQVFFSFGANISSVFIATGEPQYTWKWNIISAVISALSIAVGYRWNLIGIATAMALSAPAQVLLAQGWMNRKLGTRNRRYWLQMAPSLFAIALSAILSVCLPFFLPLQGLPAAVFFFMCPTIFFACLVWSTDRDIRNIVKLIYISVFPQQVSKQ